MFFVRIRLRCDFIKTYSGFVQLGHIWIFLLHIFDLFVHIIAVLSRTYSYFFAENTAEIVVIIMTRKEIVSSFFSSSSIRRIACSIRTLVRQAMMVSP